MQSRAGHSAVARRVRRIIAAAGAFGVVAGAVVAITTTSVTLPVVPAFADTGTITYSCNGIAIPINITGTITPAGVVGGGAFNLTNYQAQGHRAE
jgi:hypothetical protein